MFIAIVGTRGAGKSEVERYLVSKGFTSVRLAQTSDLVEPTIPTPQAATQESAIHFSGISESSQPPDTFLKTNTTKLSELPRHSQPITFGSPWDLLSHVTQNWRTNFVTVDLTSSPPSLVSHFSKRPFFLLVNVDAPLLQRYHRLQGSGLLSLEEFIRQDDECVFGTVVDSLRSNKEPFLGLRGINHLVKLNITNSFQSLSELHLHLESLDMTNTERLRPGWDTYFMTLAELASQRSNCMKRRVGAILVRDNRIVATGYNGTPRGLTNCHDGGCAQCNQNSGTYDVECLCLHAEENALLEAGRDRVGTNAILYCNTCPCLKCTIKIIQCGVKMVVYNLSYKVDEASAKLFQEAGVEIRRHVPPAAP